MRLIGLFIILNVYSVDFKLDEDTAKFSARISRLNSVSKLMRLKISFENAKFLRKNDRIEFWNENYPNKKCLSYLEGRTTEYLLVKVPKYKECILSTYLTTGSYLHLYSKDLKKGIEIGKALIEVLMKKKLAVESRMRRFKSKLDTHINKVEAINKRYDILRQKLELELKHELTAVEEDKTTYYQKYKSSKIKYEDLMYKLEQYRIYDQNLKEDRWSLDPNLYFKK